MQTVVVVSDIIGDDVRVATQLGSLRGLVACIQGTRATKSLVDQTKNGITGPCIGHIEPGHEVLSIALALSRRRSGLLRRKAQYVDFGPLNGLLQVCEAGALRPVVGVGDEIVNLTLVVVQERFEVLLVQKRCALRSGEDQVQVNAEAQPGPERYPAKNEVESVFH